MDYLYCDDISYVHTKQWEYSLNKAEEWANQLYNLYPKVDKVLIGRVVTKALESQINKFNDVCRLLEQEVL